MGPPKTNRCLTGSPPPAVLSCHADPPLGLCLPLTSMVADTLSPHARGPLSFVGPRAASAFLSASHASANHRHFVLSSFPALLPLPYYEDSSFLYVTFYAHLLIYFSKQICQVVMVAQVYWHEFWLMEFSGFHLIHTTRVEIITGSISKMIK